ncbi:hypothetical protein rsdtw13_29930 [Clostridium sp. TW13]|uniref:Uncharacterized protein n=1 Tax=Inconstantimicrobium mannanitabidum TaxID=1604901 RepID=A0ACB5RF13_9CLOT|nr:hypothetical protein rsdtw13_29930 [Clostridium sp. TW13]
MDYVNCFNINITTVYMFGKCIYPDVYVEQFDYINPRSYEKYKTVVLKTDYFFCYNHINE